MAERSLFFHHAVGVESGGPEQVDLWHRAVCTWVLINAVIAVYVAAFAAARRNG